MKFDNLLLILLFLQVAKYANIISTLGANTIAAIANAGPEMKVDIFNVRFKVILLKNKTVIKHDNYKNYQY